MGPQFGECVWGCGSDAPFNQEHIIGRQFAKALGMPFPVPIKWGDIERSTGREIMHGEALEKELAICLDDRVCERCNGNWMKKLDDLTVRFMRPALEHEGRVQLESKKQLHVARWANKVGLLLALWFHDQPMDSRSHRKGRNYVPANNFTRLYEKSRELPKYTRIWVGAIDPALPVSECFVTADSIRSASGSVGYLAAFRLKRIVFFVSRLDVTYDGPLEDWPNPERVTKDRRAMRRLWPTSERVIEWPPPARLQADDLDAVIKLAPGLR